MLGTHSMIVRISEVPTFKQFIIAPNVTQKTKRSVSLRSFRIGS
jgi:hypothetical protein